MPQPASSRGSHGRPKGRKGGRPNHGERRWQSPMEHHPQHSDGRPPRRKEDHTRADGPSPSRWDQKPNRQQRPIRKGWKSQEQHGEGGHRRGWRFQEPDGRGERPRPWKPQGPDSGRHGNRYGDRRRPGRHPQDRSFHSHGDDPSTGESFSLGETAPTPADLVWGRHAAEAVLHSERPIHRVWCTGELRFSTRFMEVLREAKAAGVVVEEVSWARLAQLCDGAVHQGIVLQTAAASSVTLHHLIDQCAQSPESPLLVAVDGITDPNNLGAVARATEAFGGHGMVVPQRRNAGLTGSVAKVAAGALEHLPVARVVNLNRSLEQLKQAGYRVVGLASDGGHCVVEIPAGEPLVVVMGSEGSGLSHLTRQHCDQVLRIPLRGQTPHLNAAVACGVVLYEIARQRWLGQLRGSMPTPPMPKRLPPVAEHHEPEAGQEPEPEPVPSPLIGEEPQLTGEEGHAQPIAPTGEEPAHGEPASVAPTSKPATQKSEVVWSDGPAGADIRFTEHISL